MRGINENLHGHDLAPLQKMIGDSRVVGLGESIHPSGGYLQAKFRLIKFLVEKMGFRGLMMETPLRDGLVTSRCTHEITFEEYRELVFLEKSPLVVYWNQ